MILRKFFPSWIISLNCCLQRGCHCVRQFWKLLQTAWKRTGFQLLRNASQRTSDFDVTPSSLYVVITEAHGSGITQSGWNLDSTTLNPRLRNSSLCASFVSTRSVGLISPSKARSRRVWEWFLILPEGNTEWTFGYFSSFPMILRAKLKTPRKTGRKNWKPVPWVCHASWLLLFLKVAASLSETHTPNTTHCRGPHYQASTVE